MFPIFMTLDQRTTENKMDCRRDKKQKRGKKYSLTCIPEAMMKGQKCNYQPDYKYTNKIDVRNEKLSSRIRETGTGMNGFNQFLCRP